MDLPRRARDAPPSGWRDVRRDVHPSELLATLYFVRSRRRRRRRVVSTPTDWGIMTTYTTTAASDGAAVTIDADRGDTEPPACSSRRTTASGRNRFVQALRAVRGRCGHAAARGRQALRTPRAGVVRAGQIRRRTSGTRRHRAPAPGIARPPASADPLSQRHDDPLRPAYIGHPPDVLILTDTAHQAVPVRSQPVDRRLQVVDFK